MSTPEDRLPNRISSNFKEQEYNYYRDVHQKFNKKLQAYIESNPNNQSQIDEIEINGNIPADKIEALVEYPIEELDEVVSSLIISKDNIKLVLSLRDALTEKINNLINSSSMG